MLLLLYDRNKSIADATLGLGLDDLDQPVRDTWHDQSTPPGMTIHPYAKESPVHFFPDSES